MRRILIDRARQLERPEHGGGCVRADLDSVFPASDATPDALITMDEALVKFAAVALGISYATAKRFWTYARAWRYAELIE